MKIEHYKKCPKCGCVSYGITRYGSQEWLFCGACKIVYDSL
ncbi:MAG: hypothetical protein AABX72_01015 [Nanoarchaeota archaeon]